MNIHIRVLILYSHLPPVVLSTKTAMAGARQVSLRGLAWPCPVGTGWSWLEPAGAGSPNPHMAVAHLEEAAAHSGTTA